MSLLSNKQKGWLSSLAKRAYAVAEAHYATDDLSLDDWRAREAVKAADVRISEASQKHYLALRGHFENMIDAGQAFGTAMRAQEEPLIKARRLVAEALEQWSLHSSYAEAIARGPRFKKAGGVKDLDEDQLKQLLYIINNRGRAKKGKGNPDDRNKLQTRRRKAAAEALQEESTRPAEIPEPYPR